MTDLWKMMEELADMADSRQMIVVDTTTYRKLKCGSPKREMIIKGIPIIERDDCPEGQAFLMRVSDILLEGID